MLLHKRIVGAEAWLLLLTIGVALRAGRFETLRRLARRVVDQRRTEPRLHAETGSDPFLAAVIDRVEDAIGRTVSWLPGRCRTCLARALAAQMMLGRRGIASELRIAVTRPGHEALTAHAWLEAKGRVVGQAPRDSNPVTLPLPAAR